MHWIALYCKNFGIIYFDNFEVEHAPIETEKSIWHKNIKSNNQNIKQLEYNQKVQ